jgi:hypothetical protein
MSNANAHTAQTYTVAVEDREVILREPTFKEFYKYFSESFSFDKDLNLDYILLNLTPKLYVGGDENLLKEEEGLFYVSSVVTELLDIYNLNLVEEVIDDEVKVTHEADYIVFKKPDFRAIRMIRDSVMQGTDNFLEVVSKLILAGAVMEKSNILSFKNEVFLFNTAMIFIKYLKTKNVTLKKN